jgi:hypothetical protein
MTERHVQSSPFAQDSLLHDDQTRVWCNTIVAVGSGYEICTSGKTLCHRIAKKELLASSCLSVFSYGITWLALDGFS